VRDSARRFRAVRKARAAEKGERPARLIYEQSEQQHLTQCPKLPTLKANPSFDGIIYRDRYRQK
jgi:hypothetical protein